MLNTRTMEYLELVSQNQEKAENYVNSLSQEDREALVKELFLVKKYIAVEKINSGVNMSGKCYECKHRGTVPGDAHSCCNNPIAVAIGDFHGINMGWFFHPYNFDPVWLRYCDGFEKRE